MNRVSDIVKDLSYHVLSTVVFAALVWAATRSLRYVCVVALGGICMDLDHLIDYFLYLKKFSLEHLVRGTCMNSGKVYLFLHGWELVAAGLLVSLSVRSYGLYLFFISLAMHLAIDNVQRGGLSFYFLSYRLWRKFDLASFVPAGSRRYAPGRKTGGIDGNQRAP